MKFTQFSLATKYSIAMSAALFLTTGCGSSSDDDGIGATVSNLTLFADSDVVNEQFGTATVRDVSAMVDDATSAAVVTSLNDFSFDLHRAVIAENPDQGSVESGYSAALALLLTSAATGGNTLAGLNNLLRVDSLVEDDVHSAINALSLTLESRSNDDLVLHTANRLFVKPGFNLQTQFLDTATADFGAPVTEADFENAPEEVANAVNGWVADQTNNFIPGIIDEFEPETAIATLNATFLDAQWQDDYQDLGERTFNAIDGTVSEVSSFGGTGVLLQQVDSALTAFEIPYAGGELSMLVMMPDSLQRLEAELNADAFNEIVDSLQPAEVRFNIPSWEIGNELNLVQLLSPFGLPSNPWDFSRLVEGGDTLQVLARQNARIEVDESGTVAAAVTVTGGLGSTTSIAPPITVIDINSPFVYALRDRATGTVLFTGRVVAP